MKRMRKIIYLKKIQKVTILHAILMKNNKKLFFGYYGGGVSLFLHKRTITDALR